MIKNKEEYTAAVRQLNSWTLAYDEGRPAVSDKEWDNLYFEVREYERETNDIISISPTQVIPYKVVNKLNKVTHNHAMLSLAKTKDVNEVRDFLTEHIGIMMAKMDGLTLSLEYKNGKLVAAETRGNGTVGEDVTHNALVISSIPNYIDVSDHLVIDGEIICTYKDFAAFENEYKNPRNFASGSIRLLDSKECAKRKLTFIVWDIIEGCDRLLLSDKLSYAAQLGFQTVPRCSLMAQNDIAGAIEKMKETCQQLSYPIDGVVFKYDVVEEYQKAGRTDHHFHGGLAFKFYDEEYDTELLSIEWSMGRTGQITPVAIFKPVDIDGSTVEKASLHNISVLHDTLHGLGWINQKIRVAKMNQIIPQITWAEEDDDSKKLYIQQPLVCPSCGEPLYERGTESIVLMCENSSCEGKFINRLDHFLGKKGLEAKGVSTKTLEKLIDWGWVNNLEDVFKLSEHRAEWVKKSGFGPKSVDAVLNGIQQASHTELWRIIAAAGIPLIGTRMAKDLASHFRTWTDFRAAVEKAYDFTTLDDFGDITEEAILGFDYTEIDNIVEKYLSYDIVEEVAPAAGSLTLDGKTFVITGKVHIFKNRDEVKAKIESLGGKVTGSVTTKTDYLINNDVNSKTAKNEKAKALDIPILTEEEFVAMIGG